jgi:DNA repair protein RadC
MTHPTLPFYSSVPAQPDRRQIRQAPRGPSHHTSHEYGVISLRECTMPFESRAMNAPETLAQYAREHIATSPYWRPRVENMAVVMLNTRLHLIGHQIISNGILNSLLVHPREIFYPAIEVAAYAIVLLHNHPSGDPSPSEDDVRVTRDLIRAGQVLKIEVLDHVILGRPRPGCPRDYTSLRELGHFYSF